MLSYETYNKVVAQFKNPKVRDFLLNARNNQGKTILESIVNTIKIVFPNIIRPSCQILLTPNNKLVSACDTSAKGDIHGQLYGLIYSLYALELISDDGSWDGKSRTWISKGDVIDGPPPPYVNLSFECILYIEYIKFEASLYGGKVISVLGNHELDLFQGYLDHDFRFTPEESGYDDCEILSEIILENILAKRSFLMYTDPNRPFLLYVHAGLKKEHLIYILTQLLIDRDLLTTETMEKLSHHNQENPSSEIIYGIMDQHNISFVDISNWGNADLHKRATTYETYRSLSTDLNFGREVFDNFLYATDSTGRKGGVVWTREKVDKYLTHPNFDRDCLPKEHKGLISSSHTPMEGITVIHSTIVDDVDLRAGNCADLVICDDTIYELKCLYNIFNYNGTIRSFNDKDWSVKELIKIPFNLSKMVENAVDLSLDEQADTSTQQERKRLKALLIDLFNKYNIKSLLGIYPFKRMHKFITVLSTLLKENKIVEISSAKQSFISLLPFTKRLTDSVEKLAGHQNTKLASSIHLDKVNKELFDCFVAKIREQHLNLSSIDIQELNDRLFEAIKLDKYDEVFRLLSDGASIYARTNESRETPLHFAVCYASKKVTSLLINLGADIHSRNLDGSAPLHIAACRGNTDILSLLLSKGAATDIGVTNRCGLTPLKAAEYTFFRNPGNRAVKLLRDQAVKSEIQLPIDSPRTQYSNFVFSPRKQIAPFEFPNPQ